MRRPQIHPGRGAACGGGRRLFCPGDGVAVLGTAGGNTCGPEALLEGLGEEAYEVAPLTTELDLEAKDQVLAKVVLPPDVEEA